MAYPQRLLAEGERIEFETRPHWRGLIAPGLVLIVTVFAIVALYFAAEQWFLPESFPRTATRWIVVGGGLLVLVLWAVRPFLRWLTTEYVFTDRRVIVRMGIISRQGRDMPLAKVNDVSFSVSPLGRVLNYGALVIQSAGENTGLTIEDVPDVEDIQRNVYAYIEADERRRMHMGDNPLPPNSIV